MNKYTIYGISVHIDEDGRHIAFIGGIKYVRSSKGDMAYLIQQLQAGIGVIH